MPSVADILFHVAISLMFLGIHIRQHLFFASELHQLAYDPSQFNPKKTLYYDKKKLFVLALLLVSYLVYVLTQVFIGFYVTLFLLIFVLWLFLFDHKKVSILYHPLIRKLSIIKLTIYVCIQIACVIIDPYSLFYVGYIYLLMHPWMIKYETYLYHKLYIKSIQSFTKNIDFNAHYTFIVGDEDARILRHFIMQLSAIKRETVYDVIDNSYDFFRHMVHASCDGLYIAKNVNDLIPFESFDLILTDPNQNLSILDPSQLKAVYEFDLKDAPRDIYTLNQNQENQVSLDVTIDEKLLGTYYINTLESKYLNLLILSISYLYQTDALNDLKEVSMQRGYGHLYQKEPYVIYDQSKHKITQSLFDTLAYFKARHQEVIMVTKKQDALNQDFLDKLQSHIKKLCIIDQSKEINKEPSDLDFISSFSSYDDVMTYLFFQETAKADVIYIIHI